MTRRDNLLERLESVNPIPDPSRIYEDVEMADRLLLAQGHREELRLSDRDIDRIARGRSTAPRTRRGLVIAAAVAALIVGVGIVTLRDSGPDVASGARTLDVTLTGSGADDATCVVNGPTQVTAGTIEIVFRNASGTPGTDFMDFARLDPGRTEQEIRDYLTLPFTDRPSWTRPVAQFDSVQPGVVSRNDSVVVQPGLHALVCGANVEGGGILPDFAVFGATIEVVPAP